MPTNHYQRLEQDLLDKPRTWLVTGAAGFIGSHLVARLLQLGQRLVAVDNLSTGSEANIQAACKKAEASALSNFEFHQIDINETKRFMELIPSPETLVLHQAALGSVPRSIEDPLSANRANVDGFLSVLLATQAAGVHRFVYASSSSVYGDSPGLPKHEEKIGRVLSPYALTKIVDELYADQFSQHYDMECIGLRYFNVFGPRQDPNGAYAAVIPCWFAKMLSGEAGTIYGDGDTSRDFCYIENAVQANLLAATTTSRAALNTVYNIACGEQLTLLELYGHIHHALKQQGALQPGFSPSPVFAAFRAGDIRHSLASILKAERLLRFAPAVDARDGIRMLAEWWIAQLLAAEPESK